MASFSTPKLFNVNDEYVTYYKYDLVKYPHAGAGKRVQF